MCETTGLAGGSAGGNGGGGNGRGTRCSILLGRAGGCASSGSPSASLKRRMEISGSASGARDGSVRKLSPVLAAPCSLRKLSPALAAPCSRLRASRSWEDFLTSQLMKLINAISSRMTSCSICASVVRHQWPCPGFSVPAMDSRIPVSDCMFFILR